MKNIVVKKKRLEFKFHKYEYEEVKELHGVCKEKFLSSFVPETQEEDPPQQCDETSPAYREDSGEEAEEEKRSNQTDVKESSGNNKNLRTKLTKTLYKKIVMHTHPDRLDALQLEEEEVEKRKKLYLDSTVAADRNDTDELVDIIVDLGLSPNIETHEEVRILNSRIKSYTDACRTFKESPEWVWYNSNESERNNIEKQILHQMGLKRRE